MATEFSTIAQRIVNAENEFIDNVMTFSGCDRESAVHVLNVYRKLKVVKTDAVNGVINVKNGAFFEKDVIVNAINYKL